MRYIYIGYCCVAGQTRAELKELKQEQYHQHHRFRQLPDGRYVDALPLPPNAEVGSITSQVASVNHYSPCMCYLQTLTFYVTSFLFFTRLITTARL
jgi:hypothetical protein